MDHVYCISITPTHGHGHSQRFASKYWKKSLVRQKTVLTSINLLFKTKFVIQVFLFLYTRISQNFRISSIRHLVA